MSSLIRKVNKSESKPNRYESMGFSRNPFPRKPSITINGSDDRENGSIYIPELREDEIKQFKRIVVPKDGGPESKNISFLMDYATRQGRGIGKTSFLNYQSRIINHDLGNQISDSTEVLFAIYCCPIPGESYKRFWTLSKMIIKSLIEQNILSIAIGRLRAFSGLVSSDVLSFVDEDTIYNTLGDIEWIDKKSKELGVSFNELNLRSNIKWLLISKGVDANFADILSRFGGDSHDIMKYYFESVSDSDWKKNGNDMLFNQITSILIEAGFTKGIILLDEVEKVVQPLNAQDRRNFCEEIRHWFIDGGSINSRCSFFNLLLVIHPYIQELLNPHWSASGLERFASLGGQFADDYTIFFKPINDDQAIPLAIEYMNKSRIKNEDYGTLLPFDKESLEAALSKSLKVPGKFLNFLHLAIEKSIEESWEKIDKSRIEKLSLTTNNYSDEVQLETNDSFNTDSRVDI